MRFSTKTITTCAVLAALALALSYLESFFPPLLPLPGVKLVLANIVADVIIPLSAVVRQFMAPGAVFICSGIIEHRWPETEAALISNGFEILDHKSEEEWHCFVCR